MKPYKWMVGLHVFPLVYGQKKPPPKGWQELAEEVTPTAAAGTVRQVMKGEMNLAAIPGRSGHVVVDVDSDRGVKEARRIFGGKPPSTVTWTTGRGVHLLYKLHPDIVQVRSRRLAPDLDVKSRGGYVVLPPSMHPSGSRYELVRWGEVHELSLEHSRTLATFNVLDEAPDQDGLRAPSVEAVREVLDRIPNDIPERDDWIRVGYAIKASLPENEEEAFQLWHDWSKSWTLGENDDYAIQEAWSGMQPPYRVGYTSLCRQADQRDLPPMEEVFSYEPDALPPKRSGFPYYSLKEAVDDPSLAESPEAVLPYLAWRGKVTMLWGMEKLGKSTVARAMALRAAEVERTVLWVDYEEGLEGWKQGFVTDLGVDEDDPSLRRIYHSYCPPDWDTLAWLVEELDPDVLVVDSLTSAATWLLPQLPDNAESEKWMEFLLTFKRAADQGRGVVVLAHSVRSGDRYAGSFGKGAAVDMMAGFRETRSGRRALNYRGRWREEDQWVDLEPGDGIVIAPIDNRVRQAILEYVRRKNVAGHRPSRREIRENVTQERAEKTNDRVKEMLAEGLLVEEVDGELEVFELYAFRKERDHE